MKKSKLKGISMVVTNVVDFQSVGGGMLLEEVAGFAFLLFFLLLGDMVNCECMWLSNMSGGVRKWDLGLENS